MAEYCYLQGTSAVVASLNPHVKERMAEMVSLHRPQLRGKDEGVLLDPIPGGAAHSLASGWHTLLFSLV